MHECCHLHPHNHVFLILKYASGPKCSVRDTAISTNCVRELILQRCGCHFGCRESPYLRQHNIDFRLRTAFWQPSELGISAKGDRLLSACRNVNCNCISALNSCVQWHKPPHTFKLHVRLYNFVCMYMCLYVRQSICGSILVRGCWLVASNLIISRIELSALERESSA